MPKIDFNISFETEHLLLRPMELNDFEHFMPLTSDKKMWYYFTEDLSIPETLENWILTGISQIQQKTRLAFTIIDKFNYNVIGSTSLGNISVRDKRAEIGWTWICKEYRGKGFNDQTKYLLLKYCFDELEFERVEFKTDVLNTFARNALVRVGATEEGILRSHTLMTNNRRRDTIYYSILKPEWERLKSNLQF